MAPKPPKLEHVKYVRRRGRVYAYFNTGLTSNGKPIRRRLPDLGDPGFFASYAACMAGRTKRSVQAFTVAHLADEYQASVQFKGKAVNTQRLYAIQLIKVCDTLGKFPVDALEPSHVRAVLDKETWGAGTKNAYVAAIGAMYQWARRRDKTKAQPTKDIEKLGMGAHEPWPDDVIEAALVADDDTVRLAVHLLYFTGQRIGDVIALRWGDMRGDMIECRQRKTGKLMEIPIHAELRAELDRTPRKGIAMLAGVNGRQMGVKVLRDRLKAFAATFGVHRVPHGLRKSAVNALLEYGCTIAQVAAITGQTHAMVEYYAARVNKRKLGQAAMLIFETGRKAQSE